MPKWILSVEVDASDAVVADGFDLSRVVLVNPTHCAPLQAIATAVATFGDGAVRVAVAVTAEPAHSLVMALQGASSEAVDDRRRFEERAALQMLDNVSTAIGRVPDARRAQAAAAILDDTWHGDSRNTLAVLAAVAHSDELSDAFDRARAKVVNDREEERDAAESRITVEIDTGETGSR